MSKAPGIIISSKSTLSIELVKLRSHRCLLRFEPKGGASEKQKKRRKGMDAAKNAKKRKKPSKEDIAKSDLAKADAKAKAEGVSFDDAYEILVKTYQI